jgi:hypothetical protein
MSKDYFNLEDFTQEIIKTNPNLNWTPAKTKSVVLYYIRAKLLTPLKYKDLVDQGYPIPPYEKTTPKNFFRQIEIDRFNNILKMKSEGYTIKLLQKTL